MTKTLAVNFVIPFLDKTGGLVVIFEHARHLAALGHSVRLYYPLMPYAPLYNAVPPRKRLYVRLRVLLKNIFQAGKPIPWFPHPLDLRPVLSITPRAVRDADIVIATSWVTAFDVAALPPSKGAKHYFVQHFEDWFNETRRLEETFRLPLRLIVIAPWLTALMKERFGREVAAEIHNGLDLTAFSPPDRKPAGPPRILMMHHVSEYKGIPMGLEALRRIHAKFPEARIRLFGLYAFEDREPWMEYVRDPSPEALADLYRESHIFLSPSLAEGWHLPPMEAMACGCAVAATEVGCIPVLRKEGNMLTCPPGDVEALYRNLEALVADPARREAVAAKGLETIRGYGWERFSREFESVLLAAAE
jgi:glycosyltransferase involved in cell wall biosynthesis